MRLILDKAKGEINLIITNEMKNFDDIEMKILCKNER